MHYDLSLITALSLCLSFVTHMYSKSQNTNTVAYTHGREISVLQEESDFSCSPLNFPLSNLYYNLQWLDVLTNY